ncbi:MAG: hypothetical protein K0R57_4967 [Paenibacillaceae bacterium]|jgi:hypothetical protein|nr:hypothetical protein [Paenibacillaceae bacterium]
MRIMKSILLGAAIAAVVTAAGCGQKKTEGNAAEGPSATPAVSSPSVAPANNEKQISIQSFYSDADLSKLVAKETSIRYSKDEDKYLASLGALKKSPSAELVSLCPNTTFTSAKLNQGKLTVDISLPDEDRLGSPGEGMLLEAFSKTLFQFSEVQSFELLVDGKKPDSLMGHYELPALFTRNSN